MKTDEFQLHTKQSSRANMVSRRCSAIDQSLSAQVSRKRVQRPLPNLWWSRSISHQRCTRRSTEMSLSVRLLKQRFVQNLLERWIAANAIFSLKDSSSADYPFLDKVPGDPGLRSGSQPSWGSVARGYFESFEGSRCTPLLQKRWCKSSPSLSSLGNRINAGAADPEDAK